MGRRCGPGLSLREAAQPTRSCWSARGRIPLPRGIVVDEVLAETNRQEQRVRTLPAHLVVYFVLALALFTDGYEEVIRKLVNGLRFARTWSRQWTVPSTGGDLPGPHPPGRGTAAGLVRDGGGPGGQSCHPRRVATRVAGGYICS